MKNRFSGLIALSGCVVGFAALAGCECECLEGLFSCSDETTDEVSFVDESAEVLPGGYAGIDYAVDGDASFDLVIEDTPLLASGASR